jgi:Carboxypeptidase regulatory-like domain
MSLFWRGIVVLAALVVTAAAGWSRLRDRPSLTTGNPQPATAEHRPPAAAGSAEPVASDDPAIRPVRDRQSPPPRSKPAGRLLPLPDHPEARGTPSAAPTDPMSNLTMLKLPLEDSTQQGIEDEATLVELRLGRLVARTVKALRVDDQALLPLGEFLTLAQIEGKLSPEGRLEATIQPGNLTMAVDVRRATATIGRRSVPIPPRHLVFHEGELFLATPQLAELLDLTFAVRWADLEVVVTDPSSLPVAVQQRRRNARTALLQRKRDRILGPEIEPQRRMWDGFVLDYSWLMPGNEGLGGSSYQVSTGTSALGGSLVLGLSSVGRADSGDVRFDASWLGVWRHSPWLKQLRLGDGVITGLGTRVLRGASLTNAPFVRPSLMGELYYGGRLAPGWEIEAYRGGELVWADSAGRFGTFGANLPVMYGENSVDFVAYGPSGEIRRFSRTYLVADELLPAGRLEYAVSGGDCRSPSCQAGANLDLRYGLSRRWAVRAGADRYWRADTLPDLFHPYAAVSGSVTNSALVRLEAVKDAFVRGALTYEPSLDLRLGADYSRFDTDTRAPLLSSPDRRSQMSLTGFFRPIPRRDFFYLEAGLQRTEHTTGATDAARLGLSIQAGDVRVLPYARLERQTVLASPSVSRRYWGFNSFILPPPNWGSLLRQVWIRTGFESEGPWQPRLASIQVARPLTPNVRLDVGLSWASGASGPTVSLNLASYLKSVRSFTSMTAARGSPSSLSQLVQGSVLYNRASGGFGLGAGPSLQRAGLAGRVFLDQNDNGLWEQGEPVLRHVRVQVGTSWSVSDSAGAYQVWDLVPFEPVQVTVDSLSFESPLWIAPTPVVRVVPEPNQFTVYDVPIILGAVLEGQVTGPNGEPVPGGISVFLSRNGSTERRRISTFSDGAFYQLGLPPGEYDVAFDPEQLSLLGYVAAPERVTVRAGQDEGESGIVIRLRSRP